MEEGADVTFDGNLTLYGKYNKKCAIKNHGKLTVTGDTTISGTQITTDPVSYTHLDVYKRQT